MKVRNTTVTEIDLSPDAIEEVFKYRLDQMCGGPNVYLDDDGVVKDWEDTGHGSGLTTEVASPSKQQVHALRFRQALHKLKLAESRLEDERRRVEQHQRGKGTKKGHAA